MLNPHTHRTTNNRDVIWLNRMYYVTPYVATTNVGFSVGGMVSPVLGSSQS